MTCCMAPSRVGTLQRAVTSGYSPRRALRRGNCRVKCRSKRAREATPPMPSSLEQDAQHAAQRFGRAPQQLVADGEGAEVLGTHGQLAQATDWNAQRAGHGNR